jgi:hypothetical protein
VICEGITFIRSGTESPVPSPLQGGDGMSLVDRVHATGEGCMGEANANWPAYGPMGDLAFAVATLSRDHSGQDRLNAPWDIYILGQSGDFRQILQNVQDLREIDWTPDGESLVFSGTLIGKGSGIWIVNVGSRELRLLSDRAAEDLSVAPEGGRMAAIVAVDTGSAAPKTEMEIVSWPDP